MFETGESLSAISKFDSVLEKTNQSMYHIMFHMVVLVTELHVVEGQECFPFDTVRGRWHLIVVLCV